MKVDYEGIFNEETPTNNNNTWGYYLEHTTGSFATALCRAYELADADNKLRLRLAFPFVFKKVFYGE